MSLEPDRISVVGGTVVIQIGDEATDSWNGISLKAGATYTLQGAGQRTRNITGWEFDSAATPQNPITVQIQGAELTLVVDPSIPQRVAAGEIIFEPIDPFWSPQQIPRLVCDFNFLDASKLSTSPAWRFQDETGNASLVQFGTNPLPTLDTEAGGLVFTNNQIEFEGPDFPFNFNDTAALFYAVFTSVSQGRVFNQSNQYIAVNFGEGLEFRRSGSGFLIWNGLLDAEGLPDERFYSSGSSGTDAPYLHEGTQEIPPNTPVFFIARWRVDGAQPISYIGATNDATYVLSRAGIIEVGADVTDDEKLRLQGVAAWQLINEGFAEPADLMPANHPYFSGPPTLAGGSVSAITLVAPSESITITGIPQGASVVVSQAGRTLDAVNEVASTYTYEIQAGESNAYRIKVIAAGFQDFEQLLDIAQGRSTIYFGVPSDSSDSLSKPYADFFDLMQDDTAFQAVVSGAGTQKARILQQLWQQSSWQADWNTAVVAAAPSAADITTWIGYLATAGFTAISFDAVTGEVA